MASGKTLLAEVSAKSIEACKDISAHITFISCSKLTLEKPATILQKLSGYISEALDHAPSLVILDDLDSLIAPSSDLEGSQPSLSSAALIEFLADMLDEYEEKQSLTNFPQGLSSSGRFDFHVSLPVSAAERSDMLRHEIQKRSLQCFDDLLSDIASKCDGYDAYDLYLCMLPLVVHYLLIWALEERINRLWSGMIFCKQCITFTKPATEGGRDSKFYKKIFV
ncbi:hypothetical protein OROHE_018861 [Orobanche hederae]